MFSIAFLILCKIFLNIFFLKQSYRKFCEKKNYDIVKIRFSLLFFYLNICGQADLRSTNSNTNMGSKRATKVEQPSKMKSQTQSPPDAGAPLWLNFSIFSFGENPFPEFIKPPPARCVSPQVKTRILKKRGPSRTCAAVAVGLCAFSASGKEINEEGGRAWMIQSGALLHGQHLLWPQRRKTHTVCRLRVRSIPGAFRSLEVGTLMRSPVLKLHVSKVYSRAIKKREGPSESIITQSCVFLSPVGITE